MAPTRKDVVQKTPPVSVGEPDKPTVVEETGEPYANSWIEIDQDAIRHNYEDLSAFFGPNTEIVCVVKGRAYGHGYFPTVPVLERAGARRFAVFSAHEATRFKLRARPDSSLQIMGGAHPDHIPWVVKEGCEPWVNVPGAWPDFEAEIARQRKTTRFHVEVETGMNRTGLPWDEALDVCARIHDDPHAVLEGVCTHLAGAEEKKNEGRVALQKQRYFRFLDEIEEMGIRPNTRHIASSSAAILDPECRLDLVRIGISLYGFWPTREVYLRHMAAMGGEPAWDPYRALSWKSSVRLVRDVMDGDFVGYGDSHQMEGPGRIAIVPVGYADGFSRGLSNLGYVLIRGRRASIVGPVNMNMLQVNVGHIPEVEPGDEVVLIGHQGDEEITVASFSEYNYMVNYEFMTRLSDEIPRHPVKHLDGPGKEPIAEGPKMPGPHP
ncbi:MAG: alanine racemase [Euryarchaeota archaeon]|nr:alanine racemase [Euryarchaeota archaeon]